MERSHTDIPGSSSPGGEPGPHFTDWREQLRDRVREIRARKLADKRAEETGTGTGETPDPAEQAAAARAEKLRAARESIEGSFRSRAEIEPEVAVDASRIEQRLEEISEEVHEAAHDADEEEAAKEAAEEATEVAAEAVAEWRARTEPSREEPLGIAARTDAGDLKLGNGDRSARRSEIADVVDSLLGGGPDEGPSWDEEPVAAAAAEPEWEEESFEILAADPSDATEESEEIEESAESAEPEMAAAAAEEPEPDPFANAPAWARASFAPRKERSEQAAATDDGSRIPPELEDVDIPAWALPRPADHRTESSADLFAATEEETAEQEAEQETAEQETAEQEVEQKVEQKVEREVEQTVGPETEPEVAAVERFAPGPEIDEVGEIEEVELFAGQVEADEDASSDDPAIEAEADFEIDLDLSPESPSAEPEAPEPWSPGPRAHEPEATEPEPDSAIAAAIDAAIQRRRPVQREQDPDGDVFLVGEFRTRGRIVPPAHEDEPPARPDTSRSAPRPPEPQPVAARTGLFDEERAVPGHDEADDLEVTAPVAAAEEIEWDLDTPDDPDTILDAQRADADPSAPVTDRIFSAVADAMVLLTIALLLAIAGAYAAGAPIVPFVQAAPLPFLLAVLLFGFAYGVFFTGTCGQTLGKMAMRVRVIGGDTFRIGYQRAAQRSLYYAVAALPVGIGLLPALRDPEHRALHDRLSNTRVVKA